MNTINTTTTEMAQRGQHLQWLPQILSVMLALVFPALLQADELTDELKELSPKRYGGTLVELKEPQVMPVLGSRLNVKFKAAVLQDKNGEVRAGILAGDTTLGVYGDNLNVTFLGDTIAAFGPRNQESKAGVYQGVLAQTMSLNTNGDNGVIAVTMRKGTRVQFDHYPGQYQNHSLALRIDAVHAGEITASGSQTRGHGTDGKLRGGNFSIPAGKVGVIARAECSGDGFWIEGAKGVKQFKSAQDAIGVKLTPGSYRVLPNLKKDQDGADVGIKIQLAAGL